MPTPLTSKKVFFDSQTIALAEHFVTAIIESDVNDG